MNINWNINWATWVTVFKAIGGFCQSAVAVVAVKAGAVVPLAAAISAIVPAASVPIAGATAGAAAIGVILHGVASMAQSITAIATDAGQANGTVAKP